MNHDVFVSYSSIDQEIVDDLSLYLEEKGVRCFMTYRDISERTEWMSTIRDTIRKCQLMVVIYSNNSTLSKQMDCEIELCFQLDIPILTFCIQNVEFTELKRYYLINQKRIDAFPNPKEYFNILYESYLVLILDKANIKDSTSKMLLFDDDNFERKNLARRNLYTINENCNKNSIEFSHESEQKFDKTICPQKVKYSCTDAYQENIKVMPQRSLTKSEKDKVKVMMESLEARERTYKSSRVSSLIGKFVSIGGLLVRSLPVANFNKIKIQRYKKYRVINKSPVSLSLFAPSKIKKGQDMLVQVFINCSNENDVAKAKAIRNDSKVSLRGDLDLGLNIQYNQKIELYLNIPESIVDEPVQSIVWKNELVSVQFAVTVSDQRKLGDLVGSLLVSLDGVPIGKIKFVTVVTEHKSVKKNAATLAELFKYYFISYADENFSEVAKRVQMLQIVNEHKGEIFLDKMFLHPGERYEEKIYDYIDNKANVFLLFWSDQAKQSEWVRKEYIRALERYNEKQEPNICPVIITIPFPNPPEELSNIHFGDSIMSLAKNS